MPPPIVTPPSSTAATRPTAAAAMTGAGADGHGRSTSIGSALGGATTKPMSVKQIIQEAQNFDYNPHIPLRYWFRTAATLLKEVRPSPPFVPGIRECVCMS